LDRLRLRTSLPTHNRLVWRSRRCFGSRIDKIADPALRKQVARNGHIGVVQDIACKLDGPGTIQEIAVIIDTVTAMMAEVRARARPANARVQEWSDWMLAGAERIYEIYNAMRDHDYLHIWMYPGNKAEVP
jgi:hypothetical protein